MIAPAANDFVMENDNAFYLPRAADNPAIFFTRDYKKILLLLLKEGPSRGAVKRASECLGVPPSYLSKVMGTKVNLTTEQAFLLAEHLFSNETEREYFRLLVELGKASSSIYKSSINKKLDEICENQTQVSRYVSTKPRADLDMAVYFSTWQFSAIHLLTSIHRFQEARSIANKLLLPEKEVLEKLHLLATWKLVKKIGNSWVHHSSDIHVPKDSPLLPILHADWRNKSLSSLLANREKSIHFSNIQTLSSADYVKLRELVLNFIKTTQALTVPSKPEECVVFLIDLFPII